MDDSHDTPRALTKPSIARLINQAVTIETEPAQESGDMGFMARAMVQATLPHRKVHSNEFVRRNGNYTLTLLAPSKVGLPYGSIPRLLLAWVTTEAVRTKSREIELGTSMTAFMTELGLSRQGRNINNLKEQAKRLFSCSISASRDDKGWAQIGYTLADETVLWWEVDPKQAGRVPSTVTLSERFFHEIITRPIPVDMRALRALKKSPLAIDTYSWLTYKASYTKYPTLVPWDGLALQFGSDYRLLRQFKAAFLGELQKVVTVYSAVQVKPMDDGLMVNPSPTHIGRKAR